MVQALIISAVLLLIGGIVLYRLRRIDRLRAQAGRTVAEFCTREGFATMRPFFLVRDGVGFSPNQIPEYPMATDVIEAVAEEAPFESATRITILEGNVKQGPPERLALLRLALSGPGTTLPGLPAENLCVMALRVDGLPGRVSVRPRASDGIAEPGDLKEIVIDDPALGGLRIAATDSAIACRTVPPSVRKDLAAWPRRHWLFRPPWIIVLGPRLHDGVQHHRLLTTMRKIASIVGRSPSAASISEKTTV